MPPSLSAPAPSAAAAAARAQEQAALLEKLAVDDLVVHSQHGLARFKGVRRESVAGREVAAYVALEFEVRRRRRWGRRGAGGAAGALERGGVGPGRALRRAR